MKKLLIVLLFVFGICGFGLQANAQVYSFKTTGFASKYVTDRGVWTKWSDWQPSHLLITMDLNNDLVTIYSQRTQIYKVTEYVRQFTDESNGTQLEFKFIDQDMDYGVLRLRRETNGNNQMYIEFSNIMWVYNVIRE